HFGHLQSMPLDLGREVGGSKAPGRLTVLIQDVEVSAKSWCLEGQLTYGKPARFAGRGGINYKVEQGSQQHYPASHSHLNFSPQKGTKTSFVLPSEITSNGASSLCASRASPFKKTRPRPSPGLRWKALRVGSKVITACLSREIDSSPEMQMYMSLDRPIVLFSLRMR